MHNLSRRRALLACAALPLAGHVLGQQPQSAALKILDTRVISWKPPLYHGWPTLARKRNGELMLAFSGGREKHVCPFGRLEWMRSKDNGLTWGWPQVVYDGPIDDRDAGIVETAKGSVLITTFTSLAYEPILARAEKAKPGETGAFEDAKLIDEWRAVHHRLTPEERQQELGCYMLRSIDGGRTWSARYPVPLDSPHGPINLDDGSLLYPGKDLWGDGRVGVCHSTDDGLTWSWLSVFKPRNGDAIKDYHELHAVQAANGQVICHIRNHNAANKNETLQCESSDGGRTWSEPHSIGVWGLPSHLLRLKDGRLLMTYGYRRKPFGVQARISRDHGQSWSDAMTLSADGIGGDLGYPSTVECDDGTLVTVWYEVLAGSPLAQLRQARWQILES